MKVVVLISILLLSVAGLLRVSSPAIAQTDPNSNILAATGAEVDGAGDAVADGPAIAAPQPLILADAPPPDDKGTPGSRS